MDEKKLSDLLAQVGRELYPFWKMQFFRQERFKFLNENMSLRYPIELQVGTYLLLHLIPVSFDDNRQIVNLNKVIDQNLWLHPVGISEKNTFEDFNFDGLIFAPGTHLKPAYTQLFRNGIIEAVAVIARSDKLISLLQLQKSIYDSLNRYLRTLGVLGINPPIYLFFKVVNGHDVKLSPQDIAQCGSEEKARGKFILRNDLEFPELIINDLEVDVYQLMSPIFNIFWNIFGYVSAPTIQLESFIERGI